VETTLHAQHAPARRDSYFRLGTSSRVTVNVLLKAVGMLLLFFWEPAQVLKSTTARNWEKGTGIGEVAGFVERNRHGADHGLDLGIGRGIALVVRTREINLVLAGK